MIYYEGPWADAMLVASDVEDNCPDLLVGRMPKTLTVGPIINSPLWMVVIAMPEECPMLSVFSFTDEKRRTFEWGLDDDRGESIITCKVSQPYSVTVEYEGEKRIRGQIVTGNGRGTTAQIAYDAALADLIVEMKKATVRESPLVTIDVTQPERPLFGDEKS